VGLFSFDVELAGEPNHSGTTPMANRKDALCAAARIVLAIREQALRRDGVVANVGIISTEPGAANVVPGKAELVVEMRAADRATWEAIPEIVQDTVERCAAEERVAASCSERHRLEPADFDERLVRVLEQSAALEGASATRLFSGAGHDGMSFAQAVPVSMLFVPSVGGVSHSPEERTEPDACALGAQVLARALVRLTCANGVS
jgi:hydantoinase/carbamoylase family amidase